MNRFLKYSEYGAYFLMGAAIVVTGVALSALSVASIVNLAKVPTCLD